MFLERMILKNFRCFESVDLYFSERMSVIAGDNGSGKTAVLEAAAIAAGTLFQPIDEASGKSINKRDATMKPFSMGSLPDGEYQYPVEITGCGRPYSDSIEWKRSLNSPDGKTAIIDARPMTDLGKSCFQEYVQMTSRCSCQFLHTMEPDGCGIIIVKKGRTPSSATAV